MSAEEVRVQPNTFGNISKPGLSGILGLPMGVSLMGVPLIIFIVLLMVGQHYLLAVTVAVLGIVAAVLLLVTRREGRSIYGRMVMRLMQKRKERTGQHLYVAGPTGRTPDGAVRLPGILARSELSEHRDTYGNAFGMLRVVGQGVKNYSVVIECYADGDELVDQRRVSSMVAHWGAWLAQRGVDEGIRGASVTVESAPDSGLRLRRLMENNASADGSEFAREVAAAIPREYSGGAPTITTRLTVTFDGSSVDGKKRDRGTAEMAAEIGNRLPVILAGLTDTGAGTTVRPCTAQEIIDNTRSAYDPTIANDIEEMKHSGGTGLRWEDAGPSLAVDAFDYYRHDRAISKSWTMYEGPRGVFYASSMRRALEPMPDVLRKRVTILYRPIPAGETTDLAERGIKDTTFAGSQKRGISPATQQKHASAVKAAQEEAQGAGFERFGIIVTISVTDPERFHRLKQQVPAMFNGARLRVREALANQAVTFQAGLPLGMVLPDHMMLPSELGDFF